MGVIRFSEKSELIPAPRGNTVRADFLCVKMIIYLQDSLDATFCWWGDDIVRNGLKKCPFVTIS